MIPFNKPAVSGNEWTRVQVCIQRGKISGNGYYTHYCQGIIEQAIGGKALLTNSGTAALDMAAILCDVGPGDEVIMPSFTFTSTANAFMLRGARVVFADVDAGFPNMRAEHIAPLINERTKVLVIMHYAGVACDMDPIMELAASHHLLVVEDAAMGYGAAYNGKPLGSFGHLAAISFHETKVLGCGEGGCLVVNHHELTARAEIIWEKGTNRAAFARGEINTYKWVDIGSSFLMSEIQAAWLSCQLDRADQLLERRLGQWRLYDALLANQLPEGYCCPLPVAGAEHNGSIYYIQCPGSEQRKVLIQQLHDAGIMAVFHYQPLHLAPFYTRQFGVGRLPETEKWADTILRLPLFDDLTEQEITSIANQLKKIAYKIS
jgi:dTDP-4-amino-4,6-dideoxygalactose transaminase